MIHVGLLSGECYLFALSIFFQQTMWLWTVIYSLHKDTWDTSHQLLVQESHFQCFGLKETETKKRLQIHQSVVLNAETFNSFANHKFSSSSSEKQTLFCNFAIVLELIKYTLWSTIFHIWSVEHLGILVLSFSLKSLLLQHCFFRSRKTGKIFSLKTVYRTMNTGQVKRWVHFQGPQTGLFPGQLSSENLKSEFWSPCDNAACCHQIPGTESSHFWRSYAIFFGDFPIAGKSISELN